LQTLNHYITYSVITSEPALTYSSVVSTIRCYEVTSGEHAGGTFVSWSGNFSGDADAGESPWWIPKHQCQRSTLTAHLTGVVEDAKHKRREALADLAKAATSGGHSKMT